MLVQQAFYIRKRNLDPCAFPYAKICRLLWKITWKNRFLAFRKLQVVEYLYDIVNENTEENRVKIIANSQKKTEWSVSVWRKKNLNFTSNEDTE